MFYIFIYMDNKTTSITSSYHRGQAMILFAVAIGIALFVGIAKLVNTIAVRAMYY